MFILRFYTTFPKMKSIFMKKKTGGVVMLIQSNSSVSLFYNNRGLLFIPPRDHVEPGKEKCEIDTAFASVLSSLSFHFEMHADPLSDRYQLEKLPQLLPFPPRSLSRAHQDYHVILPLS